MIVAVTDKNGNVENLEVPRDESGFYKKIAEKVSEMPFPNIVTVTIKDRIIVYDLTERGGTCNIQERSNNIVFKQHSDYSKKHLTYADFVSAEKKALMEKGEKKLGNDYGSYKFYTLESDQDGTIKATWGSMRGIGAPRSCNYPVSMFWVKYYEKIAKGYIDNTEAYVEKGTVVKNDPQTVKRTTQNCLGNKTKLSKVSSLSQKLYKKLKEFSTKAVCSAFGMQYTTSSATVYADRRVNHSIQVTQGMIDESKKYLAQLYDITELDEFNKVLLKLCMVCPRKIWDMKSLMASNKSEMVKVLEREEDLVAAMEGITLIRNKDKTQEESFDSLGISISAPTDDEAKIVKDLLTPELKNKVKKVYKVYKKEHADRFNDYVKKNGIKNTKLLWHGSRNENWLSIIGNGLLLKPNAIITGKMFGNGIYFAPKASKSWGYTSYSGTYWANGNSHIAFMGVYETAYGNPYHPHSGENWQFTEGFLKNKGKNCVHAKGGECGLRNDEIIFYNEAAMCLRYVVEFE